MSNFVINPFKVSTPVQDYDSGLGSDCNFTTINNLSANSSVTSPTGLGPNSWVSNGTSTELSLTAGQIITSPGDFTVSLWVYPTDIGRVSPSQNLINRSYPFPDPSNENGFQIELKEDNKISVVIWSDAGAQGANGTSGLVDDAWANIIVTWVQSTGVCTAYVDNVSKATFTSATISGSSFTQLGWSACTGGSGSTECFDGRVLDIAIWKIALSNAQRASILTGKTADKVAKTDILCYWDCQTSDNPNINLAIPP